MKYNKPLEAKRTLFYYSIDFQNFTFNSPLNLTRSFRSLSLKEGAAILEQINKNHHKVILGIKLIIPLFINIERLFSRLAH